MTFRRVETMQDLSSQDKKGPANAKHGPAMPGKTAGEAAAAASLKALTAEGRFAALIGVLNSLGTLWIFLLMLIIVADVLSRAVFNAPIHGIPEIVEMSIVAIVFLQFGHTLRVGRLTRSDSILGWLLLSFPRLGHVLNMLSHLLGVVVLAIILWRQVPRLEEAYEFNLYKGYMGQFHFPTWPLEALIVLCCAVGLLQFALFFWRDIRRWRDNAEGCSP